MMIVLELNASIRGYHVYQRRWSALIGEILQAQKEERNTHDRYAVALFKEELGIVGHVPKRMSKVCHSFLTQGVQSRLLLLVQDSLQMHDLPQGGLDVSCRYIFSGDKELV